MSEIDPLTGRRIGVPESRQLDLFADMLARRGARVTRCPLVDIRDAPDPTPIRAWVDDVLAHGLDDMIWLTGEGVRRLGDFVARIDPATQDAFWQRQRAARTITRGPKPVRELRPRGIGSDLPATEPTTAGVIAALAGQDLSGRRVGIQRYGTEPNTPLMDAVAEAGGQALPVAPYVYADEAEDDDVAGFIDAIVGDRLDAVAFTSSPQVKRLFKVARQRDCAPALTDGLKRLCVAAVGPLIVDTLASYGIEADLVPETNFFMKPLVRALSAHFADQPAA
ncbi:uroporphyrinogen-III synthase [Salinisphaera sp. Q1T1-3]|uniref:uroporphyrinogen-III synthase n=1 Tax=Salinisphaera sp. Q1T1-3 TaxID=2321229 RepID=UPI000E748DC3|nr:uroporphyrinogen-III synthase [Salinisphaera sp. Q1T1-3]RJS91965.1 uroporphyrinogen III synthase [Salinisphaera sp. Q1T1-3]